jgi:hypothetical protein
MHYKLLHYRGHKAERKFRPTPPRGPAGIGFFKTLRVDHDIAQSGQTTMPKKKETLRGFAIKN